MPTTTAPLISIPVTLKVSEDTLQSALTSGMITGSFGYGYWCDRVQIGRKAPDFVETEYGDEDIARNVLAGGTAICRELDEDSGKRTSHTLTRRKLLNGFARWVIEGNARHAYDAATGTIEFDMDAPSSDLILQFALFGEQVYG